MRMTMNLIKTKLMTPENIGFTVDETTVENVEEYDVIFGILREKETKQQKLKDALV